MENTILDNIKIILIGTSHPGNIGAAARAMKTMGISKLGLVSPHIFPSSEITARAAGADDILAGTTVHDSLTEAVGDCIYVYGTSARFRSLQCEVVTPKQAATEIIETERQSGRVAIVFGRESSGLSNEELDACNKMIVIPTSDDFSSLNLASAVQIICYELFRLSKDNMTVDQKTTATTDIVTNDELNNLYKHLQECLVEIGFLDPEKPRRLMRRLKQLFNRSALDQNEYNILRGILTAIQEKLRQK